MKRLMTLTLATMAVCTWSAIALASFEKFFDKSISNEAFLTQVGTRSTTQLADYLKTMKKNGPSKLFTKVAAIDSFDITPTVYGVRHAINYYIPKSYKADGSSPVLILLHGGGASTNTYESSKGVAQMYMGDWTQFSEKHGMVIVAPASSLGWAYNTRMLVSEVMNLVNSDLSINPDRIILWGHSMGAMGLTREAHWLSDKAAAVLADAGGMQDEFRIDQYLLTYFNLNFIHSQGLNDQFSVFVTRTKEVQRMVKVLESELAMPSRYEANFQDRDHNPNMSWTFKKFEDQILKTSRDIYQKNIFPLMVKVDAKNNRLGPDVDSYLVNKYFWIEAPKLATDLPRKEFDQGKGENFIAFKAVTKGNTIDISVNDPNLTILRVLLSSQMVNLDNPVTIQVNGRPLFEGAVKADQKKMLEIARTRNDPKFLFDTYVDINLK